MIGINVGRFLLGCPAAIQGKARPGDILGRITGQKQSHIRDLLGHQKLTRGMFFADHRNSRLIIRQACFLSMRTNLSVNKLCQNKSRANRVTSNILLRCFQRDSLGQPNQPVFSSNISRFMN